VKAWFIHGWGEDSSLWEALVERLSGIEPRFADRGYFGGQGESAPEEPSVWIAHSFGTVLALDSMSENCRGLVAINGFDRFCGEEGVPRRVLDRMIARFEVDPEQVVSDFRAKCGYAAPMETIESEFLARDLAALRDMDCRDAAAELKVPVLSLQGAADPILPPEMREATLPNAQRVTHPTAGHLLPIEEPDWCAEKIHHFLAQVAV